MDKKRYRNTVYFCTRENFLKNNIIHNVDWGDVFFASSGSALDINELQNYKQFITNREVRTETQLKKYEKCVSTFNDLFDNKQAKALGKTKIEVDKEFSISLTQKDCRR